MPKRVSSLQVRGFFWGWYCFSSRLHPCHFEGLQAGQEIHVCQVQRLLGLMAAAANIIRLRLLYMRPFLLWLKGRGFHPLCNPLKKIRVMHRGLCSRSIWGTRSFSLWVPWTGGRRKTVTTDTCLTGWGVIMEDHPVQGIWRGRNLWHINRFEMKVVFLALKYFLPDLRG